MSRTPGVSSIILRPSDLRAAVAGTLARIVVPLVSQPPERFKVGDVAPVVHRRDPNLWAISKCDLIGVDKKGCWPPGAEPGIQSPLGNAGDRLWVREPHCHVQLRDANDAPRVDDAGKPVEEVWYRADAPRRGFSDGSTFFPAESIDWLPATSMARRYARMEYRITRTEIALLQREMEGDGFWERAGPPATSATAEQATAVADELDELALRRRQVDRLSRAKIFRSEWDARYGHGAFDANPWVWIVSVTQLTAAGGAPCGAVAIEV